MGQIHADVREVHLQRYPAEEQILKPFLSTFDITWGSRRKAFNTSLSVFFLRPEQPAREMFGLQQELLLCISDFPTLEPRTIQAAESFLHDDPGKGRLDKLTILLVSRDTKAEGWVRDYAAQNQESRVVVAFTEESLLKAKGDPWFVRNAIARQLFVRDLFDYRLPLERDLFFFGREGLVQEIVDATKRGENRGVFGLRKTGKTSLLFKVRRQLEEEGSRHVLFYDCKSPSIRSLRWHELLSRIARDISEAIGDGSFKSPKDVRRVPEVFQRQLEHLATKKKIVVIFDEIEYISHIAIQDPHWKDDFAPFWQAVWSIQSQVRSFSFVIVGVNPFVTEVDKVGGIQNPLFGIVSYKYLRGLEPHEVRRMLSVLGRRMGIQFTAEAFSYLAERYGGHPLLTRIACSIFHREQERHATPRPINAHETSLRAFEAELEDQLVFYSRHVVSELQEFYPDEYRCFELLAAGAVKEFAQMAARPELVRHLQEYGLLRMAKGEAPKILIPVLERYVAMEEARRAGRRTILSLVTQEKRNEWLALRTEGVTADMRHLERLVGVRGLPKLFGPNSFPEADRFIQLRVANTKDEFVAFINVANRCFVESLQNYGKAIKKPSYLFEDIKRSFPSLSDAFQRIRLYRHHADHLELKPDVEVDLSTVLRQDLEGRAPGNVDDLWFTLQQCTLDGLLNAIQMEIYRLEA